MPVMRRIGRASRTRRANDSGSKTYALPELGDGRPLLDLVEHGTEERRATGGHVFIELPPPGCAAAARAVVEDGEGKIRASPLVQPRKAGVDRGHELFPRSSGRRLVGSHRGATAANHAGAATQPTAHLPGLEQIKTPVHLCPAGVLARWLTQRAPVVADAADERRPVALPRIAPAPGDHPHRVRRCARRGGSLEADTVDE